MITASIWEKIAIRSSSATAQPICFIPEDRYVSLGSTCTVVGWGKLLGQKGINRTNYHKA